MKGYDKPALPVELVSFAMDGWGTTLRYDFAQDVGETITAINLSPDMKKIMIVKGEITGCDNYLVPECKLAVRYKVADTKHFHDCQKYVGHHFALVYGDYGDQIAEAAEALGLRSCVHKLFKHGLPYTGRPLSQIAERRDRMIYFDNSATTCVDAEVADRAVEIMCRQFGNPSSLHGVGSSAYTELGIARNQIAKMIAARTGDIYFTSGGTESNNIAVQGAARACRWGKHIVTTAIEHASILKACAYLESGGWQVTYVAPNPDTHHIAAQDIIDAVRDDTVLVSVMFVNNETGEILPIKEIVNGVRKRNPKTLIHCDCVQGFGKLPFKLHVYDVDMISASAHKIHGPKGIGALYLRRPDLVFPLEFGGSQEGKVNPGTESVPPCMCFWSRFRPCPIFHDLQC